MRATKPELLAPAGSFMAAYYAFEAGADAVYVGLRRFSARSSAQNFTLPELAKLKKLAIDRNKKIYVTLNTVVREDELDDLVAALADLNRLGVDAVLVQDAGVLTVVRDHFPDLSIHASTQMAVHNAAGVKEAARLGIRRVVLPREMTFDTAASLSRQFPDMEFEVFIHGALCYSFSGLCLASGLMGGGSGNRGACAQVCRLRFTRNGRERALLSCRDLFTGPKVKPLAEAGIDSLKIEGRLKPASYVYHTVRLYRFILDHERPEDEPEYSDLLAHSGFVFSRERTRGRLFGGPDEQVITSRYERSVGFPVGRVEAISDTSFSFTTATRLQRGDVLQIFLNDEETSPFKLPIRKFRVAGHPVSRAEAGTFVSVESDKMPAVGQTVSKVYDRRLELPGVRHKRFSPYTRERLIRIVFDKEPSTLVLIESVGGHFPPFSMHYLPEKKVPPSEARERVRRALETAEGPFRRIAVRDIVFPVSPSGLIGIPGGRQLKNIREAFGGHLVSAEAANDRRVGDTVRRANRAAGAAERPSIEQIKDFIRRRENLNPPAPPRGLLPFYQGGVPRANALARCGEAVFIPLQPVVSDEDHGYFNGLERFIHNNSGLSIYLGVNNLHHVPFVRTCEKSSHVFSFIDFFFYLANAVAVRFALTELKKTAFGYYWIEGNEEDHLALQRAIALPLFSVGPTFKPPFFYHAGDFLWEGPQRKENAAADGSYTFQYDHFHFEAVSKDTFTCIFPT